MRKQIVAILSLLTVMVFMTVATKAEVYMDNTEHSMTGSTTVRLVIPSSYIVEIPATVSIPYGATSTPMTIGVNSMELGSQQTVEIAVESAKGELLQTNGSDSIPYTLSCNGEKFSHALYPTVGETELSIDIALEDWFKADAGEYTGAVTFHVSVVNQEVAP